jgi:hypothetical protein
MRDIQKGQLTERLREKLKKKLTMRMMDVPLGQLTEKMGAYKKAN